MKQAPFLPYGRQLIEDDDIAGVVEVLRSDFLTTGPAVTAFEEAFARCVGATHAVSVSNGTAALHAACFAAGVDEGDEVIVPAVTFLATANCARYLGAEPVFADVDPDTGLILVQEVKRRLSERTRAVIPVHLAGTPVDLRGVAEIAREAGIRVIEDASHALGSRYAGAPVGSLEHSDLATYSFHPLKHITTAEGGAVVANDRELLERLLLFRNHGMTRDPKRLRSGKPDAWYYEQQLLGYNFRLSDIQCALGLSQLAKLERFVARRWALAERYDALLEGIAEVAPVVRPSADARSAYHLYPVLIDFAGLGITRSDLVARLRDLGIGTQVHYIPLPAQPYYRDRGWRPEDFPGAERYYQRTLSLPLFPAMEEADVDRVVDSLEQVLTDLGAR